MRWVIAALVLGVVACDASSPSSDGATATAPEGYVMEIRATQEVQTYLVTTPDGRTIGARAAGEVSALMDAGRAQALAAEPPPEGEPTPEVFGLRMPGFEMSVGGDSEDENGDNGQVSLSIGGEQNIEVRADEGGPGDADDVAYVRISGADEADVRDFINEAEELSPDVKTEMLGALGLH